MIYLFYCPCFVFGRLEFDPETFKYNEPDGVEVRVPDFGSTKSIEYLDASTDIAARYVTKYFHDIVQYFVDNAGYERDESIVAAPYDWRKSPCKFLVRCAVCLYGSLFSSFKGDAQCS